KVARSAGRGNDHAAADFHYSGAHGGMIVGSSLTAWVALHCSMIPISHRETIVLKALKKLFKPGKTPAPHHETHIEPAAAPVTPGSATPTPAAQAQAKHDKHEKKD